MTEPPDTSRSYRTIAKELIERHLSQNNDAASDHVDALGIEALEVDGEHARLETELLRSRVHRYKQDTSLRELYANRVYCFMLAYTIFTAFIVLFSSLPPSANICGFPLRLEIEPVPLATLIGGAFASAVGLVAFVVKGLFPNDRQLDRPSPPLQVLLSDNRSPTGR